MPELPEVETVRATLENRIIGEKVIEVYSYCDRITGFHKEDLNKIIGQKITKIARIGKYLIFIFEKNAIISHLRMEGKYFIKNIADERVKHEHIIFNMESKMSLRYHDTRKFGTMHVVDTTLLEEILLYPELKKLGKEANDPTLTGRELYDKLKRINAPIKTTLLNQEVISGLGNIYVDEVLYACEIHPLMPSSYVTLWEVENIASSARSILNKAIRAGGTTIRSYTSSLGVTGRFQLELDVHTKDKTPCKKCGEMIIKTKVGGRGTYLCPNCQKMHPLLIGITGGISTGKSTITSYILKKGYLVIDTDLISRSLTLTDIDCLNEIRNTFGDDYFDGLVLNRAKLGALVFKDREQNEKLCNILHPRILKIVMQKIKEAKSIDPIFIDVPLLYESGFDKICNKTICIWIDLDTNIQRLMNRDKIDHDYALTKIKSQMSLEEKMKLSTYTIDNSKDLCYTYTQVDKILNKIVEDNQWD